jgi:16S rRNA (guanine527-N7)-methyltransferase
MLEEANSRFSLTGAKGWERVRDELFIKSMRFMAPAGGSHTTAGWFEGRRVIDIGSGAGIPGLVIKLLAPGAHVTLLDSSAKKTSFLREVIDDLKLENVDVVTARAEEAARERDLRQGFDLVVSRGVARLVELAELTIPFAAVGGTVVAAKGSSVDAEIAESEWAVERLGAAPAMAYPVSAPGDMPADTMVYWLKIENTSRDYPRRNGVPHTSPLIKPAGRRTATMSR